MYIGLHQPACLYAIVGVNAQTLGMAVGGIVASLPPSLARASPLCRSSITATTVSQVWD
jgi:hypothetical protein